MTETSVMTVPQIMWRDRVDGLSAAGQRGYVGTFDVSLFSYGYSGGQGGTTPWRLVSTLPGYTKRQWMFDTQTEAETFAQRLLTKFLSKIFTTKEDE